MGFLTSQWSGRFRAAHRRVKRRMDALSPLAEKIRAAVFLLALGLLVAAALANVRRAPAQAIAFVIFVLIVGGAFSTYLMLDASTRGVVACKPGEKCTKPLTPKD